MSATTHPVMVRTVDVIVMYWCSNLVEKRKSGAPSRGCGWSGTRVPPLGMHDGVKLYQMGGKQASYASKHSAPISGEDVEKVAFVLDQICSATFVAVVFNDIWRMAG